MAQKNMKKKLFFLAILLCVSSCGNNQSDLTTGGNNTPTTSSELTPTTSEVVDTTPKVTTQQTTTHIHTFEDTLTYDETHHWYAATCGHDDAITKTKHTYEKVVTKPTYEEKGDTTHTCLECGYSYVDNETELLRHTITYNLNGGTNASSNPSSFTVEDKFYLRSATKEGYAFLGWVDKNGNIVTEIKKGTNYDIELTAQWSSYLFEISNNVLTGFDKTVMAPEIRIPNKVTKIGDGAFEYCFELVSIVIPSSVTTIGQSAFNLCWELTIYCEATSKPSGWDTNWNSYNCSVYWAGQWKYDENNKPIPLK